VVAHTSSDLSDKSVTMCEVITFIRSLHTEEK